MNFASYEFWKILILCFASSRLFLAIIRKYLPSHEQTCAKLCLLTTALTMLASENILTLAAFLFVVILGWLCVLLQSARWPSLLKHATFFILLVAQLAPLFYYKYWNFILNDVIKLNIEIPSVIIPMGLSFYTFQTIGFWVDNLRNPEPRPSFLDYLNFSSFFPQIVAGPIEKRESLLPQIEATRFYLFRENFDVALRWIVLGLAYKMVIADNLGVISDKLLIDPSNAYHVWLQSLTFGMRIYFDFAGYSFIAIGLGLIFGVHLTLNFRSPYMSANLRDFWRNWHITLGAWLRDYIYLPLGGRKNGRWVISTLIVFIVSGAWHGAGWGFVIWGLLHGLGVAWCGIKTSFNLPWIVRWVTTFLFTTAVWLFFLETNTTLLWQKAASFINPYSYGIAQIKGIPAVFTEPINAMLLVFFLFLAFSALILEGIGLRKNPEPYHLGRTLTATLIFVFLIIFLSPMEESRFIYFNF